MDIFLLAYVAFSAYLAYVVEHVIEQIHNQTADVERG